MSSFELVLLLLVVAVPGMESVYRPRDRLVVVYYSSGWHDRSLWMRLCRLEMVGVWMPVGCEECSSPFQVRSTYVSDLHALG